MSGPYFEKGPFRYTPKTGCGHCGAIYTVNEDDIEISGEWHHYPSFDCRGCKRMTIRIGNLPNIVEKRILERTRSVYLDCKGCNKKYYPEDTDLDYLSECHFLPLFCCQQRRYRLYNCDCGYQNEVLELLLPQEVLNRLSDIRVKKK